jgi:hypothetical protein
LRARRSTSVLSIDQQASPALIRFLSGPSKTRPYQLSRTVRRSGWIDTTRSFLRVPGEKRGNGRFVARKHEESLVVVIDLYYAMRAATCEQRLRPGCQIGRTSSSHPCKTGMSSCAVYIS